jgi:cellulose synthase/poly-beta-1,6-N-acetylglucosamine synthase-like glycosyltransferase
MLFPKMSVVMPVYNAASTVVRDAKSILDGEFADLELIVVDDGSTDDSVRQLNEIGDDRLRVVKTDHCGIVAALNTGVRESKTPLIARMDADDVSHPSRLMMQMAMMDQADIVGCAVNIVDEQGHAVESMRRYEQWINDNLEHTRIMALRFVESPLVHPTVLARREVFEMGYRDGPFPEDYDLWLKAMAGGYRVMKVSQRLLDWTEAYSRLTRIDDRYSAEAFDRCRREHLLAGPLKQTREVDLWGVGQTGKPWLRWLIEQGFMVRRMYDIDPKKVGEQIHGVRVLHPDEIGRADGVLMVVAVGAAGARELIEQHAMARGYELGEDVWFVA